MEISFFPGNVMFEYGFVLEDPKFSFLEELIDRLNATINESRSRALPNPEKYERRYSFEG